METHHDSSTSAHSEDASLARSFNDRRARAESFLAEERLRMEQIEERLLQQVREISLQMADQADTSDQVAALEEHLNQRRASLEASESTLKQAEKDISAARIELQGRSDDLEREKERLDRAQKRISDEEDEIAREKSATRRQRRRIADEMKERRDDALSEIASERADLKRLREASTSQEGQAIADLKSERDGLRDRCDQMESQAAALEEKLATAEVRGTEEAPPDSQAMDALETARDELQRRLDEATSNLESSQRRCNALEEDLASAQESSFATVEEESGGFDWEAQKKRMMASLEGEDDPVAPPVGKATSSEVAAAQRIIATQKSEIARLKKELQAAQEHVKELPDPNAEVLDQDAVVQEERDKLTSLRAELHERQREAEVGIALERAKLAREKATLEDKMAQYENQLEAHRAAGGGADSETPKAEPKSGSRWRMRLGLNNDDEEES